MVRFKSLKRTVFQGTKLRPKITQDIIKSKLSRQLTTLFLGDFSKHSTATGSVCCVLKSTSATLRPIRAKATAMLRPIFEPHPGLF